MAGIDLRGPSTVNAASSAVPKIGQCDFEFGQTAAAGANHQLTFDPGGIVDGSDITGTPDEVEGFGLTVDGSGHLVVPQVGGKILGVSMRIQVQFPDSTSDGLIVALVLPPFTAVLGTQTAVIVNHQAHFNVAYVDYIPPSYTNEGDATLGGPTVQVPSTATDAVVNATAGFCLVD